MKQKFSVAITIMVPDDRQGKITEYAVKKAFDKAVKEMKLGAHYVSVTEQLLMAEQRGRGD